MSTEPKPTKPKDYYRILGLPRNATVEQVETAFAAEYKRARRDPNGGDEKRAELGDARAALKDEKRRAECDLTMFYVPIDLKCVGTARIFCWPNLSGGPVTIADVEPELQPPALSEPVPTPAQLMPLRKPVEFPDDTKRIMEQLQEELLSQVDPWAAKP